MNLKLNFMNHQSIPVQPYILKYGALLGAITVTFSVMLHIMEMDYQQPPAAAIVSIASIIALIIFAFIQYRRDNEGFISLGEALKIGMGIGLISGLLGVVYLFVLTTFIDPDFMSKLLDFQQAKMQQTNPNMTQEQLDQMRSMQEKFSSPLISGAFQIISSLFISFIISLIGGLIVKKSRPE